MKAPIFSIVILTYERERYLINHQAELLELPDTEIIVVDNNSSTNYAEDFSRKSDSCSVIKLDKNYGAVGRSFGMRAAKGKYIITLDDDVWGIDGAALNTLKCIFEEDDTLSCINFKVIDEFSGEIVNWSHKADKRLYSDISFKTYEISEGACAFRKDFLQKTNYYPLDYFISHEGKDIAFQILNLESKLIYTPNICVTHAHAKEGRASWRRYYYDTRNAIWIAYKYYPLHMIIKRLSVQLIMMLLYSIRDGFVGYYIKAIFDAVKGIKNQTRNPISAYALSYIKEADKLKPPATQKLKERLLNSGVRI